MRSPSSCVSSTRFASARSAPFIHGGTAGRMSTSSSIGVDSPWPPKVPLICAGTEDSWLAVGSHGVVDWTRTEDVEHTAIGESQVDLDVVCVPLIGDGLDSYAGKAELDAVVPDPSVHGLAHFGILGLFREDELEFVV